MATKNPPWVDQMMKLASLPDPGPYQNPKLFKTLKGAAEGAADAARLLGLESSTVWTLNTPKVRKKWTWELTSSVHNGKATLIPAHESGVTKYCCGISVKYGSEKTDHGSLNFITCRPEKSPRAAIRVAVARAKIAVESLSAKVKVLEKS